jgi:hypothetical protein
MKVNSALILVTVSDAWLFTSSMALKLDLLEISGA